MDSGTAGEEMGNRCQSSQSDRKSARVGIQGLDEHYIWPSHTVIGCDVSDQK